jgi:hypothetical protein
VLESPSHARARGPAADEADSAPHSSFGNPATVYGKIYVIGGRTGHAFILFASNTDVVEDYSLVSDMWSALKERMPTPCGGGPWGRRWPPDST